MGFCRSDGTGRYIPNTVLKGDIRSLVHRADRILLTFRKKHSDQQYTELVYAAKKTDWSTLALPAEYTYLPLPEQIEERKDHPTDNQDIPNTET